MPRCSLHDASSVRPCVLVVGGALRAWSSHSRAKHSTLLIPSASLRLDLTWLGLVWLGLGVVLTLPTSAALGSEARAAVPRQQVAAAWRRWET